MELILPAYALAGLYNNSIAARFLAPLDCSKVPRLCWYFKQSMGIRNRVGIRTLYRPARARICKPFKEPGIDSQPAGQLDNHSCCTGSPGYIGWRNQFLVSLNVYKYWLRPHWLAELVPWNRFLGSLNVYKNLLRLHWLVKWVLGIDSWAP
jgi:hypothetical protein